jgi:hypothetical protein
MQWGGRIIITTIDNTQQRKRLNQHHLDPDLNEEAQVKKQRRSFR